MTTDSKKYPLSVMKGYKPQEIRYLWYIKAEQDGEVSHHSGFTIGGITNLQTRGGKELVELRVADLQRNRVYLITDVEQFMELWGEHYFDPEWKIPQTVRA